MRRGVGVVSSVLLALAMLVPGARPVAADSVCPTLPHLLSSFVSFPAGFWQGADSHEITISYSVPGETWSTSYTLAVDEGAALYPGRVLVTPVSETELQLDAAGHSLLAAINPGQATAIGDYFVGPLADLLWLRQNLTETVSWDGGGQPVQTSVGGFSSMCLYGGPNKTTLSEWLRHYGPAVK